MSENTTSGSKFSGIEISGLERGPEPEMHIVQVKPWEQIILLLVS